MKLCTCTSRTNMLYETIDFNNSAIYHRSRWISIKIYNFWYVSLCFTITPSKWMRSSFFRVRILFRRHVSPLRSTRSRWMLRACEDARINFALKSVIRHISITMDRASQPLSAFYFHPYGCLRKESMWQAGAKASLVVARGFWKTFAALS